ncbi:hypothetical protein LGT39_05825 [Demequina sp. TTPB684]|uniref:hypothetical protein n=1 Tax=unclassified Demequina TaxID=2620311 RepID=UPI001CF3D60D|nr:MULTISPECIES: hypothetical protein [unclassified Demequina]MCB2412366.1 hypothetical protein [Demequina sp. TTPB684]UPU89036.1 hypothetical protein LGT36_003680 [Demequina sp. TMPB413]
MSFLRVSDSSAYDPRTLHPLESADADERTVDEVFGFSVRLAAECGSKENDNTDRRATLGMVRALAGSPTRATAMMAMLVAAGAWRPDGDGWELINDEKYLHLRAQGEIDRDRVRQKDARDDMLTVPARLRDGDNCRYCSKDVNWSDRKSLRGATWEHVNIAAQPTALRDFVVCCFACNREPSSRGPLLAPPEQPKYGPKTREFVRERLGKWPTRAQIDEMYPGLRIWAGNAVEGKRTEEEGADTGLRTSSEHAPTDQRPARKNATQDAPQRPENVSENASGTTSPQAGESPPHGPPQPIYSRPVDRGSDGSRSAGSGRVGTGLVVPGLPGSGTAAPTGGSKRSRRRKEQR